MQDPVSLPPSIFEQVAGAAGDGIVVIDEQSRLIFVNSAAASLFGYGAGELMGRPLTDLMPPEFRDAHRGGIRRYLSTGQRNIPWQTVELPGLHRNGRRVPLEISFAEARTASGAVFAGFLRDLTERHWSQARLASQHAVTQILGGKAPESEVLPQVLDCIGRHLEFAAGSLWMVRGDELRLQDIWAARNVETDAFEYATRASAFVRGAGLPGRVWATAVPAWIEDLSIDENFPRAHAARASGLASGVAFPLIRNSVVIGVMEFFSTHVRPPEPSLAQILSTLALQISQFLERKQAETALHESEAKHRVLFENANDAFGVSADEKFVYVNQAFADMFGYDNPGQLMGVSIYDTIPATQRPVIREQRRLRTAGIAGPMRYHSAGLRRDGTDFQTEIRATDYWMDGRMFTLAILRDITAELLAQEALLQSNEQLRRANEDLEEFANAASHDLQEPLRMITLYTDLLVRRHEEALPDDAKGLFAQIRTSASRMNELVRDLLSYTQAGQAEGRELGPVDPGQVLAEVLQTLSSRIAMSHARITFDPLPPVLVHRTHLLQIFQNLISNGLKYHKINVPPAIHISGIQQDAQVTLSVRDEGIGISPEYHDRIFGVFKRLHTAAEYPGTGIGLAIVKKVVERYNGAVWLDSAPGGGAQFNISLPAAPFNSQSLLQRRG